MTKLLRSFDSLDAIVREAVEKPVVWKYETLASDRRREEDWYKTSSFDHAVQLARYGWPEGKNTLTNALQITAKAQPAITRAMSYDVAGMYPDVGLFCAGDPMHMVTAGEEMQRSKPIVRFLIQRFASAITPAQNIINQGAAILSCVDTLESNGFSCEIECVVSTIWSGNSSIKEEIRWKGKNAGEPLDIDRMAFMLINPSMLRRIVFRLNEQLPEAESKNINYGRPDESPEVEPGQLYFPQPATRLWTSPEKALEQVVSRLHMAGIPIDDPLYNRIV